MTHSAASRFGGGGPVIAPHASPLVLQKQTAELGQHWRRMLLFVVLVAVPVPVSFSTRSEPNISPVTQKSLAKSWINWYHNYDLLKRCSSHPASSPLGSFPRWRAGRCKDAQRKGSKQKPETGPTMHEKPWGVEDSQSVDEWVAAKGRLRVTVSAKWWSPNEGARPPHCPGNKPLGRGVLGWLLDD